MRVKQLDPAVWVIVALVGATLVITLMVLAARSCVQAIRKEFEYPAEETGSYEQQQWVHESVELQPAEYAAFMEKVRHIDLGIGIHLGMDMKRAEAILGESDMAARMSNGGYEYTYWFMPDATGPSTKQRHRGDMFGMTDSADLYLTVQSRVVVGLKVHGPFSDGDSRSRWPFLILNRKPLMQCGKKDFIAVLGVPNNTSKHSISWRFIPAGLAEETSPPAEVDAKSPEGGAAKAEPPLDASSAALASRGVLADVMFDYETGSFWSFEIRQR